jgi:hypothetical protein
MSTHTKHHAYNQLMLSNCFDTVLALFSTSFIHYLGNLLLWDRADRLYAAGRGDSQHSQPDGKHAPAASSSTSDQNNNTSITASNLSNSNSHSTVTPTSSSPSFSNLPTAPRLRQSRLRHSGALSTFLQARTDRTKNRPDLLLRSLAPAQPDVGSTAHLVEPIVTMHVFRDLSRRVRACIAKALATANASVAIPQRARAEQIPCGRPDVLALNIYVGDHWVLQATVVGARILVCHALSSMPGPAHLVRLGTTASCTLRQFQALSLRAIKSRDQM